MYWTVEKGVIPHLFIVLSPPTAHRNWSSAGSVGSYGHRDAPFFPGLVNFLKRSKIIEAWWSKTKFNLVWLKHYFTVSPVHAPNDRLNLDWARGCGKMRGGGKVRDGVLHKRAEVPDLLLCIDHVDSLGQLGELRGRLGYVLQQVHKAFEAHLHLMHPEYLCFLKILHRPHIGEKEREKE